MSTLHHQTTFSSELFGADVHVCFTSAGRSDNLDIQVVEAWLEAPEEGTVTALNRALTRTSYSRVALVDLDRRLFPLIRNGAWDSLLDAAQRDRDPSMNGERMMAAE